MVENPVEVFSCDLAKDRQKFNFVYRDGASVLSLELGTWNVLKKSYYWKSEEYVVESRTLLLACLHCYTVSFLLETDIR